MKEAALHLGVKKDTTRASPRLTHRSAQKTWQFPSRFWEVEAAEEGTVHGEVLWPWGQSREKRENYLPNVFGDERRGSLHPPTCLPLGRKATDPEDGFLFLCFPWQPLPQC